MGEEIGVETEGGCGGTGGDRAGELERPEGNHGAQEHRQEEHPGAAGIHQGLRVVSGSLVDHLDGVGGDADR